MIKKIILGTFALAIAVTGLSLSTQTAFAMNKAELIEAMASNAGLSKADSKKALEGFLDEATDTIGALKKGDRLSLVGFGSFSVSKRSESAQIIKFSPEIRNESAKNRHAGEIVSSEDIAEKLSKRCTGGEKRECPSYDVLVKALIAVTAETLSNGEAVEWDMGKSEINEGPSFGTFTTAIATSISKRSARTGRNPQTGKEIQIAAKNTVKFKAGAELSKAVN